MGDMCIVHCHFTTTKYLIVNWARSHGLEVKVEDSKPRGRRVKSMLEPYTGWNVNED